MFCYERLMYLISRRISLYSFAQQNVFIEWLFDKTAKIMRALILLVCLSLRIFLQEIRSLEQHLEVVSFNAVTVFFCQSGTVEPGKTRFS